MRSLINLLKTTGLFLVAVTVLTGLFYPGLVTFWAQLFFPYQAQGSLLSHQGKRLGSELIGQAFTGTSYFWGRPSATSPYPYHAASSSGGISPEALLKTLQKDRLASFFGEAPPLNLLTRSGSGLDPHITPEAALYQVPRLVQAHHLEAKTLVDLIHAHTEPPQCGIFGISRVNVLKLNLALKALVQKP